MQKTNLSSLLLRATLIVSIVLSGCSTDSGSSSSNGSATNTTTSETSTTSSASSSSGQSVAVGSSAQNAGSTQTSTAMKPTTPAGGSTTSTSTASAGTLVFSATTFSTKRASGEAVLTVARRSGSAGAVTVNYSTRDGTAVQGTDYDSKQGTLMWEDGDDQPKTITVKIPQSDGFAGSKEFAMALSGPSAHASLGSPSTSTVTIVGALVTKSISEWVKCDGTDNSEGTKAALNAAKNNAFALLIDCPIRIHFSGSVAKNIVIESGTTVEFQGDGAVTIDQVSPPPVQIPDPSNVSLVNWNVNYAG